MFLMPLEFYLLSGVFCCFLKVVGVFLSPNKTKKTETQEYNVISLICKLKPLLRLRSF